MNAVLPKILVEIAVLVGDMIVQDKAVGGGWQERVVINISQSILLTTSEKGNNGYIRSLGC